MDKTMLTLSQQRCAVREYTSQQVPDEVLQYILEVARLSPSAVNYQPWHIVVIRGEELLGRMAAEVYPRQWFSTVPCCVVVCGNHNESWRRSSDGKDHCDIDVAIVTQQMVLAAAELGVATCWVCNFDVDACKRLLQLPQEVEPIVLLPIGYPASLPSTEKQRKSIDDIVTWL